MKKITLFLFFIIGVGAMAQPANDLCANAITLATNSTVSGTTIGATFDNVGSVEPAIRQLGFGTNGQTPVAPVER